MLLDPSVRRIIAAGSLTLLIALGAPDAPSRAQHRSDTGVVADSGTLLYAVPPGQGDRAIVRGWLAAGQRVDVLDRDDAWARVAASASMLSPEDHWVDSVALGPLPPSATPEAGADASESVPMSVATTVPPVYPPALKGSGARGIIVMEAAVGLGGNVEELRIVIPSDWTELDEAALMTARQWTFRPAVEKGQLSRGFATLTIRFRASPEDEIEMPHRSKPLLDVWIDDAQAVPWSEKVHDGVTLDGPFWQRIESHVESRISRNPLLRYEVDSFGLGGSAIVRITIERLDPTALSPRRERYYHFLPKTLKAFRPGQEIRASSFITCCPRRQLDALPDGLYLFELTLEGTKGVASRRVLARVGSSEALD